MFFALGARLAFGLSVLLTVQAALQDARRFARASQSRRRWFGDESMSLSLGWFVGLAALAGLGYAAGHWLGRGGASRAWTGLGVGVALVIVWAWLHHHPAVALNVMPANVLRYLEGTAAVPIFMLIVGIAWTRSRLPRQRRVAALATLLGAVYFLQGALWMVQDTPSSVMGRTVSDNANDLVYQSQEYSCVPAACATALKHIGLPTSEAQMAELTDTRAGSGATLIRAMAGLERRLERTSWSAQLVEPTYDQLLGQSPPMLTPLRLEAARRHMVTLLRVDPGGVWVGDPTLGRVYMRRDEFMAAYEGQAIVFTRR